MTALTSDAVSIGAEKQISLARLWAEYRAYRSTLSELRTLTEKQLADVGISRNTIKPIAREAVYGQ